MENGGIVTQQNPDSTWSARARIGVKTIYGYGQNLEAAIKDVVEGLEQEDMPKHEPMSEHKEDTMKNEEKHERTATLKTCPHCGENAARRLFPMGGSVISVIECTSCGATSNNEEQWNKRTTDPLRADNGLISIHYTRYIALCEVINDRL